MSYITLRNSFLFLVCWLFLSWEGVEYCQALLLYLLTRSTFAFLKYGKSLATISSNILSYLSVSLLLLGPPPPIMHMLVYLIACHGSLELCLCLFFFLFLLFRLGNHNWTIFKFTDSFFCFLNLLLNTSSKLKKKNSAVLFSAPEFLVGFFKYFLSLYWYYWLIHSGLSSDCINLLLFTESFIYCSSDFL